MLGMSHLTYDFHEIIYLPVDFILVQVNRRTLQKAFHVMLLDNLFEDFQGIFFHKCKNSFGGLCGFSLLYYGEGTLDAFIL